MRKIAAVVTLWDNSESQHIATRNCLRSFLQYALPDIRLYVVDNASPHPQSLLLARKYAEHFPQYFTVIANETNQGYSGGQNAGLLAAYNDGTEYFFVLNNDIEFYADHWYKMALDALSKEPKTLCGPRLIEDNLWVFYDGKHHPYIEGWCLAFRACFLEEVGFFDERFFPAWAEDAELSWRATRRGYGLRPVAVMVKHHYGMTAYDGRVRDYLTDSDEQIRLEHTFPPNEPKNIQTARVVTQKNINKFRAKIDAEEDGWVGPATFQRRTQ